VITAAETTFQSGTWPSIRKKDAPGSKKLKILKGFSGFIKLAMERKVHLIKISLILIRSQIR
jgi:hypothetical protein